LGSGKRVLPGFIHVDIADFAHIDYRSPIDRLGMFESRVADEIYSSHSLEYFDLFETEAALREWWRVLKPGGELYLAVPDFRALIRVYEETQDLAAIHGPLFGRWPVLGTDEVVYHKSAWDSTTLVKTLSHAGFEDIEAYDPAEFLSSIDPDFDDYSLAFYPHFDRTGIQISLCLRARKPEGQSGKREVVLDL